MSIWLRCTVLFAAALLAACASHGTQKDFVGDARRLHQSGDFDKSYRSVEDALGSNDSATRLASYDFIVSHPEIRNAAAQSFEPSALERTFATFDAITGRGLEQVRLSYFAKFASDAEVARADSNLDVAYRRALDGRAAVSAAQQSNGQLLLVNEAIFIQLGNEDREKIRVAQPTMQVVPMHAVGRLISNQIVDKSKPNTTSGAQLGSVVAQAAYIDQSRRSNYSAVGQVGVGLVGAIIGSTFDRSAETRFLINYGVQFMDGSVKAILTGSADGIAAPNGQCVFAGNATEAASYLCSDTLVGFLQRAKSFSPEGTRGDRGSRIVCKVEGVGAIRLSTDDCSKLGGQVE